MSVARLTASVLSEIRQAAPGLAPAPRRPGRWPAAAALGLLVLVLGLGGCATPSAAPGAEPPQVAAAPAAAASQPLGAVTLVVETSEPAARKLLEQHLDLAKLQRLRDDELPDNSEWARLIGAAPAQARTLLQTEGWFDPQVTVQREAGPPDRVHVKVLPGTQVHVSALALELQGALRTQLDQKDSDALATQEGLQDTAAQVSGRAFRNSEWSDTKQRLLARLRAAGYASARITASRADVDTASARAQLAVTLDSGPLFLAGPLVIQGLQVHDQETVRNLAGFGPGAPLTEARLLDYQERLQRAGLFDRATVSFEPDLARANDTPVLVVLSESPLQQATIGLGFSATSGARSSWEHTHRRPFGLPMTAYNKLELGHTTQAWTGDFYSHPHEGFYRNLLGVQVSRVVGDSDVVLSQRLRLGRTQDTRRFERLYFLEWLRSRQTDATSEQAATAISGNYHWIWRQLDSVLLPTRGFTLSLQGGGGVAYSIGAPDGLFTRAYGRATGYLPLGASWYGQARLEAGEIFKRKDVVVPDALGFRAGGDDSVRGYGYRDLAPRGDDGTIRSGQLLLTGSLELARPFSASLPSVWGAMFVDAGRAADSWNNFDPALGYGVGVRWRSPIGPLRVDWAWGEEVRHMRLHMSIGIAF